MAMGLCGYATNGTLSTMDTKKKAQNVLWANHTSLSSRPVLR